MNKEILVIGIGNIFRNDDGAGVIAIKILQKKNLPNTKVIELSGEGVELMTAWENFKTVIIIDAVSSGDEIGKIFFLNANEEQIPKKFFNYSTHAFSLAESIELSRVLGELPEKLIIYGIEGKNFSTGQNISIEVEKSIYEVVNKIEDYILEVNNNA